jgi:hypothetical protein
VWSSSSGGDGRGGGRAWGVGVGGGEERGTKQSQILIAALYKDVEDIFHSNSLKKNCWKARTSSQNVI